MQIWHDLHYQHHQYDGLGVNLPLSVHLSPQVISLSCKYLFYDPFLPSHFSTDTIKPVEKWLLFNLGYPFLVIITNIIDQVNNFTGQLSKKSIWLILELWEVCPSQTNYSLFDQEKYQCWKNFNLLQCFCCSLLKPDIVSVHFNTLCLILLRWHLS